MIGEAAIGTEARVWHDALALEELYQGECLLRTMQSVVAMIPPGRCDLFAHWQRVFDRVQDLGLVTAVNYGGPHRSMPSTKVTAALDPLRKSADCAFREKRTRT